MIRGPGRLPGLVVLVVAVVLPASIVVGAEAASGEDWGPAAIRISEAGAKTPQSAIGPDGTTTVTWLQESGSGHVVQARTRLPGGDFQAVENLSTPESEADGPQIGTGPQGATAVVWVAGVEPDRVVRVTTRPPGGTFGPVIDLSATGGDASAPRIAIGPEGTMVVTWASLAGSESVVQARIRPPGGSFGPVADLSAPGGNATHPEVAVGPGGAAVAVWDRFEGLNGFVQVSTRLPGGGFGEPEDLSDSGPFSSSPEVSIGPDSATTVVWAGYAPGTGRVIRTRTRSAGGAFSPAEDLSDANSDSPRLSIGSDGTAAVIWTQPCCTNEVSEIYASVRPPSGQFGAPEAITDRPTWDEVNSPGIGVRPDGSVISIWSSWAGRFEFYGGVRARTLPPAATFGPEVEVTPGGYEGFLETDIAVGPDGTTTAVWGQGHGTFFEESIWTRTLSETPPVTCPPKTLKTGKLKRNKKKGSAKLAVTAGGKGKVILKGSKKVKKSSKKVGSNGKGKVTVKAKGKAARTLKKKGRVKFKVKLTYSPGGGCAKKTVSKKVKLVRRT